MGSESEIEKKGENSPKESDLDWLEEADLWEDQRHAESKSDDAEKSNSVVEGVRGITTFLAGMVDDYKDRFLGKAPEAGEKGAAKAVEKGAKEAAEGAAKGAAKAEKSEGDDPQAKTAAEAAAKAAILGSAVAIAFGKGAALSAVKASEVAGEAARDAAKNVAEGAESAGKAAVDAGNNSAEGAEKPDSAKRESGEKKEPSETAKQFGRAFGNVIAFVSNPMDVIARNLNSNPDEVAPHRAFENLQVNNGVVEEVTTPQGTFRLAGTDKDGKDKYVHIKPGGKDDDEQEFKGSVAIKDGRVVVTNTDTGKTNEYIPKPVKYDNLNVSKDGKVDTLDTPERSYRNIGPGADGKDQYLVTTKNDQEGRLLNGSVTVKDGKVTITDKDSGVTHEYRNTEPTKPASAYEATRNLTVNATRAIAGDGAAKQVDDAFKDPAKIQKWYNDASEKAKAAEAKNSSSEAGTAKGPGSGDVPKGEAKPAGSGGEPKAEAKGPGTETKTDKSTPQQSLNPEKAVPGTTVDGKPVMIDGKPISVDGKPVANADIAGNKTTVEPEKIGMPRVVENQNATIGGELNKTSTLLDGAKNVNAAADAALKPGTMPIDGNKPLPGTIQGAENSLLNPSLMPGKDKTLTPSTVPDNTMMRPSIDTSAIAKSFTDSKTAAPSGEAFRPHDGVKASDSADVSRNHNLADHKESPTTSIAHMQPDQNHFVAKGGESKVDTGSADKHVDVKPITTASLIPGGAMERSSVLNANGGKSLDSVAAGGKALDSGLNPASTRAQIEASSKPPADAVGKMLPQPNLPGGKDQVLPLNISSGKVVDGGVNPQSKSTDVSALSGKTEGGRATTGGDVLTAKVQMTTDSRQSSNSSNSANVLGGTLNQNRPQDGGAGAKTNSPGSIPGVGGRDQIQTPGGKAESGLLPAGGKQILDAGGANASQVRIDPVTGRVIRAEAGVTAIGINGIGGIRNEVGAGAISLTSATRRSSEGHYMIAEMTLAVVLAAGGIRRVLPTDRSAGQSGPGTGGGDGRRQIERELGKLREPARVDSLKFQVTTFKLTAAQQQMLTLGIKSAMCKTELASGRTLHLSQNEGSRAFLMAVGQYREAKALTSMHAAKPQEQQQIALGYTQAQMVPVLADGGGSGRNFAMPVQPSALDKLFKAQQQALEEVLRPLLNPQDFIEMNDPFESFKNFTTGKRRSRGGGSETLEKQTAGADGGDDGEQEEEPKKVVLMRPTWLISPGETLLTIAEEQYSDPFIAWLIADLNKGNCQEHWMDGKRIVEFQSRQKITLPVWQDIVEFYGSMTPQARPENLVTIVAATEIDREVVDSVLGPIVATKSKFVTPKADPPAAESPDSTSGSDQNLVTTS